MFKFLKVTFLVCFLAVLAVSAAGFGLWKMAGLRYYSVQTDSMSPLIRPGDLVISVKTAPSDIKTGDIISYKSSQPNRSIVDHRVYKQFPNHAALVTKGDNLSYPDPPIAYSQVTGKTVKVVPGLGRVLDIIRSPLGLILMVYVPLLLISAYELSRLALHFNHRRYDANANL